MNELILYSAPGCHLCESALQEIELCLSEKVFQVEIVNIHDTPDLIRAYGTKIPVLFSPLTQQALFWPFDRLDVMRFLQ